MSSRGNEPAYPVLPIHDHDGFGLVQGSDGMTLREHYAGLAMAALIGSDIVLQHSNHVIDAHPELRRSDWLAEQSLGFADALLAALEASK